jgi:hypothetical protein
MSQDESCCVSFRRVADKERCANQLSLLIDSVVRVFDLRCN